MVMVSTIVPTEHCAYVRVYPFVFATLLLNVIAFDASQYLIHRVSPSIGSNPNGGSLFDPNLEFFTPLCVSCFRRHMWRRMDVLAC